MTALYILSRAVEIVGMEMATDGPTALAGKSCIAAVGADMTRAATQRLMGRTGLAPADVQVIELHDCFSANELITYEALGLCGEGEAAALIDAGDNTYGGRFVVNPSGGLISKVVQPLSTTTNNILTSFPQGHPLGATGLAQCYELCSQVRGEAGPRQVPNTSLALQHNLGLGGAVVVGLYRRAQL